MLNSATTKPSQPASPASVEPARRGARGRGVGGAARLVLGWLLGCLVRAWVGTLRLELRGTLPSGPCVLAFWHGEQLPLLKLPRTKRTHLLVSHSRDGQLQCGVMRALGFRVHRGSSSRGGSEGLRRLVRQLKNRTEADSDVALAVDGPRGPLHEAKAGAVLAAQLAGAALVPLGASARRSVRLGTWDQFMLPLPFSRVTLVVGEAVPTAERSARALTAAINACSRAAALEANEALSTGLAI